ncbi:uncharacterized protein MONBRDRAFT_7319 [Monosiga brevicollis MX1]|uniref:Uncharacterized protein n=1 Tax=Monosiga brevicollis TaxID=81824 RepID=A9UWL6_MONBE|nr:uncharacterized protein MONBRDRAFT_7319 [Monosiga brevicollis MX1]EDQ90233.1 predicted protein [Monosiga brevicollis MX1]|eukprot:XP_001745000.1 hypothetical protein [Monosiga brevicollis MX1]
MDLNSELARRLAGNYDLALLEHLEAVEQSLVGLSGLTLCRNLRRLNINQNRISDSTAVAKLPRLETFLARGNRLRTITPLRGHATLQHLDVRDNAIVDWETFVQDCASLPQLRRLDFAGLGPAEDPAVAETEQQLMAVCANLNVLNGKPRICACTEGCAPHVMRAVRPA